MSVSMDTSVLHRYDFIGFKSSLRLRFPYSASSYPFYPNKSSCLPSKTPPAEPYTKLLLPPATRAVPTHSPTKHATLLLDTFHEHHTLKALLSDLQKRDSCPLLLLKDHGDWNRDHFWVVVKFLREASRSHEILKVLLVSKILD